MDVLWLQRDFGIYLVNMFDTQQASRHLNFRANSLAYLLKELCAIDTNKAYQLADWRQRPLSANMKLYARTDTHYLLEIYDKLRVSLIESALANNEVDSTTYWKSVLSKSTEICATTFKKPKIE